MANTIKVDAILDAAKLNKGVDGINSKLGGLQGSLGKAAGALKGMAIAGAAALAGAGIVEGIKGAISAASDLSETVSKTQQVFGKASPDIIKFGDNASKAFGVSKLEALSGLSAFGNLFDQIGIGAAESAKMSKGFLQMSADLGSFNNADPAAVMDSLLSATRGEYDALQAFVPTVNAAKVETEALGLAHKKSAKDLTDAEKATALYSLVTKGMGKAQGDFARTSGGLANQQRILSARFKDLTADLGAKLLPIALKVVTFFGKNLEPALNAIGGAASRAGSVFTTQVLPKVKAFGDYVGTKLIPIGKNIVAAFTPLAQQVGGVLVAGFNALVPKVKEFGGFLSGTVVPAVQKFTGFLRDNSTLVSTVAVGVGAMVIAFKAYQAAMAIAAIATKAFAAVQAALNVIMSLNPLGIVILAIVGLVAALIYAYKNSEKFRSVVDGAFKAVKTAVLSVINFFKALPGNIAKAVGALGSLLKTKGIDLVTGFIKGYVGAYIAVGKFFLGLGLKVATAVGSLAKTLFRKGVEIINGLASGYASVIGKVADFFKGIGGRVLSAIGNFGSTLFSHGSDLVQGLINGIAAKAGALLQKARDLAGSVKNAIGDALKIGSPSKVMIQYGKWTADGLAIGMGQTSGVRRAAAGLSKALGSGLSSPELSIGTGAGSLSAGGNHYSITVNVPIGADPAEAGRQLVKSIQQYERFNGKVFSS